MTVILGTTWWVLANTAVHWIEGDDIKEMCYNAMLKCGIFYVQKKGCHSKEFGTVDRDGS